MPLLLIIPPHYYSNDIISRSSSSSSVSREKREFHGGGTISSYSVRWADLLNAFHTTIKMPIKGDRDEIRRNGQNIRVWFTFMSWESKVKIEQWFFHVSIGTWELRVKKINLNMRRSMNFLCVFLIIIYSFHAHNLRLLSSVINE